MRLFRKLLLAAALIMSFQPMKVQAEGSTVVLATDLSEAGTGDTVTVTATASALSGAYSLAVKVSFNPSVFEATDITWNPTVPGVEKSAVSDANRNGYFSANYIDTENNAELSIPDNTVFVTAKLKVKDKAPTGSSKITLSSFKAYDSNSHPLSQGYTATPGDIALNIYQRISAVSDLSIEAPVKLNTPQAAISNGMHYQGTSITWSPSTAQFAGETSYTASVRLTSDEYYRFASGVSVSISGANIQNSSVSSDGKVFSFDAVFPATANKIPVSLQISPAASDTQYDDGDAFHDSVTATVTYDDNTREDVSSQLTMPTITAGSTSALIGYTHAGTTVNALITLNKAVMTSISGTLTYFDTDEKPVIRLYPSGTSEASIESDIVLSQPVTALSFIPQLGVKSVVSGKASIDFAFRDMAAGSFQAGIFLPGKHVIKIVPVTIASASQSLGSIELRKYGDVNNDGDVNGGDGMVIYRYYANQTTVLDQADEYLKKTADVNRDGVIDGGDGMSIYRYYGNQSSAFDNLK